MVDMVLLSKKLHSSYDETNAKSFYPSPPRLHQQQQLMLQQQQHQQLATAQNGSQLNNEAQGFDDAGSDCDSVRSNGAGDAAQHRRHQHTYDVPFHVRRPPGEEETYSKVKRVMPTPVPSANVYQVPQVCDIGRKTLERRRSGQLTRELASHQQWLPTPRCPTPQLSDYRTPRTSNRPHYNGDDSDSEPSPHRGSRQAEDDDLHEVSEAECDREISKLSFMKGDGGLRVLMPPVNSRETPYL
ncbi:uncharacterized protein LOC115324324 [Ixodes scapularis]|uniref:uncharacterized protein LOC115324324 n=1 Tax=Ixodes scapularis TaxID=6945 RepID=UPI001161AE8A|nr:uncharacterized protein LOC115324324 [Ixodes scapularis]